MGLRCMLARTRRAHDPPQSDQNVLARRIACLVVRASMALLRALPVLVVPLFAPLAV
jgi:hypothetical protein